MAVDIGGADFEIANIEYWSQFGNFIFDFIKYQDEYGKDKGENTKTNCLFCGNDACVDGNDGNYYCSKCSRQIGQYGEGFETTPKYELEDEYVLMTVYDGKGSKKTKRIPYRLLPYIFYQNLNANNDGCFKESEHDIETVGSKEESAFVFNLKEAIKSFKRAKKLANTHPGEGHDNWLNGIIAQFDLTFTVKAWTEAERYHFFDFISSQSTMHRIAKFDLDNQYNDYVDKRMIDIMNELKDRYNETNDKEDYLRLLYSNPCGFKLTAAMTTNYRQLKTMYNQRKDHRLPEWQVFCSQLEEFPYFTELCLR